MSLSVINNNFCTLKRVRPLIITNDKKLNRKFIKEKLINVITAQNKKIFSLKTFSSNNINIKSLMTPNVEKAEKVEKVEKVNVYDNTKIKSLKHIITDESKEIQNNKNTLTEDKSTNFTSIKSEKNLNLPPLKNNFIKNANIPSLNSLLLKSRKRPKNEALKINKSTNVSNENHKFKNNTDMNNINKAYNEKNTKENPHIKSSNDLQSPSLSLKDKQFMVDKKFPLKKFLLSKTNYNKRKNQKQKMNFITNVKSIDSRIEKQKILDSLFHKTISKNRKKNLKKKDESMESLSDNSIWVEYTKIEKDKNKAIERNKLNMKERIRNLEKLFKNSYSYKKYKKKGIKNQKEKYLNFLDDYSLSLRVNFIKNNILNDRGGKQNLRVIYNPLMK